ncbi:MAG: biopolymer transporter ExbD [Rhodobacteraceae bacterium]|nr:biopolymer transporter ExbD [Paracoccaceae bacterium]
MRLRAPFPRRRALSLTPMIDVVFLLLVFFMLAARFGGTGAVPLAAGGGGAGWQGPPRLVAVGEGGLRLNGVAMDEGALMAALARLGPGPVVLRPEGATVGRLVAVAGALRAAGYDRLVVVE